MIYYLRDRHNRTIIETEFYTKKDGDKKYHDISSSVNLVSYTRLIEENIEKADEIAIIFDQLSELRGWLWENHYMVKRNFGSDEDYKVINEHINNLFKIVAEKYNLIYITD